MKPAGTRWAIARSTLACSMVVVVLSSIDMIYDWSSPSASEAGQSTEWGMMMAGLRGGALLVVGHDAEFAAGLQADVHLPQAPPFPFYAGAGPDSGGVGVAVWLLALVAWATHCLVRLFVRRSPDTILDRPER